MYNPENQFRCTIIRGKSQSDMEDLLPLYADMVHKFCPSEEGAFISSCRKVLSKALFNTEFYDLLTKNNQKTVRNHLTEVAGVLLGLYYPITESDGKVYIYESESCKYLIENNDFPTFFKNLCLNFQFPNGAKKPNKVEIDLEKNIRLKPFCFVVALLYYAQSQKEKALLTKQEIGYYVLNNLDALSGNASCAEIYERIIYDRQHKIRRERLSGSKDWQHIKEQFNLLELSNIVETNATYIWLNKNETKAISIFLKHVNDFVFDAYKYNFSNRLEQKIYYADWKVLYSSFNKELINVSTSFFSDVVVFDKEEQKAVGGATKSTVDLGDEGEALVYRLEQERVRNFRERLVNKVLLLGKTKGLGYDISSIEADENTSKPEFARYIEVKSTKRVTEPSFDNLWMDTVNITAKEWVAAEQYGEYYNIYRVFFTKTKTFIVRIQNPYKKYVDGEIEVFPTSYQMNFSSKVIELRYAK